MRTQERKDLQAFLQKPISGFWALRVLTLSVDYTADRSRKESRRVIAKKGKRSRPGFRPRSKGKGYTAWENDQQDSFLGKRKGRFFLSKGVWVLQAGLAWSRPWIIPREHMLQMLGLESSPALQQTISRLVEWLKLSPNVPLTTI